MQSPSTDKSDASLALAASAAVLCAAGAALLGIGGLAGGFEQLTLMSYLVLGAVTAGGTLVHDWVSAPTPRGTLAKAVWPCGAGAVVAVLALASQEPFPLLIAGTMFVFGGVARFVVARHRTL